MRQLTIRTRARSFVSLSALSNPFIFGSAARCHHLMEDNEIIFYANYINLLD